MRAYIRGPSIGPVRTVLWSSGHPRRRTPYKGRIRLYFIACALTGCAFTVAGPLGWAALVLFFILPAVVYVIIRRRKAVRSMPDDGRDTGWKAEHVPASAEYRAAHPEGPRDWEPVS